MNCWRASQERGDIEAVQATFSVVVAEISMRMLEYFPRPNITLQVDSLGRS